MSVSPFINVLIHILVASLYASSFSPSSTISKSERTFVAVYSFSVPNLSDQTALNT